MLIMTLNCGSSSVKYSLVDTEVGTVLAQGLVERVTVGGSSITHEYGGFRGEGTKKVKFGHNCPTHIDAIQLIIDTLLHSEYGVIEDLSSVRAVGHRVVHGGETLTCSTIIDSGVLDQIRANAALAPLHNPPNIAGIEAAQKLLPQATHVAVFDTAFHQSMPEHAYLYGLPYEWYEKYKIRRYGFHGTSHLYVSKRAAVLLKKHPQEINIITLHIGNGVSAAAVNHGQSIDTSMGFTPLEGSVMGTRCGDIDPAIPLYVMQRENSTAQAMDQMLNKRSGVLGITGRFSDYRELEACAATGDHRCQVAIEIVCYRLKKYIGAYAAAMGGLDAIVFTAGVGENSAVVRGKILEGLEFLGVELDTDKNAVAKRGKVEHDIAKEDSAVRVFVIPTNEELVIVEDTQALIEGRYEDHMNLPYCFTRADYVIY